jgi:hypothetical protein
VRRFNPQRCRIHPSLCLLLAALAASGCGYYSTSATGGGTSLKSIAVPLFKNETLEAGLEETVTRAVVDAFVADNHLAVVSETEAESILWGAIADYRRIPFSFDAAGSVTEYKLEIVARVEYEDRKHTKTLWTENDLRAWATYRLDAAAAEDTGESQPTEEAAVSEDDALKTAVEKLSRELIAKTLGGW